MTMKVLRVKKTSYFDVFSGSGWKNWTRVQFISSSSSLMYINGRALAVGQRNQLHKYLIDQSLKGRTS